MPYIRASGARPLSPEVVQTLAHLAGVRIPADDLAAVASALTDQLASIGALNQLDVANVNPAGSYDPRWHDHD